MKTPNTNTLGCLDALTTSMVMRVPVKIIGSLNGITGSVVGYVMQVELEDGSGNRYNITVHNGEGYHEVYCDFGIGGVRGFVILGDLK